MSFVTSILSFSKIYDTESFYLRDKSSHFIDLSDISGTNCMCDDAAVLQIRKRIFETMPGQWDVKKNVCMGDLPYGLHFIDNGNYHYMSAIFLEQVKEPFSLVVLDHHPDMQRPMFDILSCGGWVMDVAEKNPFVRDIHIIGADPKLISELDHKAGERAHFYDLDDIFGNMDGKISVTLPESSFPVYLSVDKDVVSRDELVTNWDQGEAKAAQILEFIRALRSGPNELLGADICGECAPGQEDCDIDRAIAGSDEFNAKVLELLRVETSCT
jgi:hypothetical protein